jgi:hypothetical protein
MDMYVEVWNLLERGLANRVPQTQALIRESATDRTSEAGDHGHECGASTVIELAHIVEMLSRNDERVAWVELP